MKKTILLLIIFILLFTSVVGAELRSGITLGNEGYGLKVLEYIWHNNISFYAESKMNRSGGLGRWVLQYYINRNNGFYGNLSFAAKSEKKSSSDDFVEVGRGLGVGVGYVHQLSNHTFLNVEGGYNIIEDDNSGYYLGASYEISWTNWYEDEIVSKREEREEKLKKKAEEFLNRHPDISDNSKEIIKKETPIDKMEFIDNNSFKSTEEKNRIIQGVIWLGMSDGAFKLIMGEPRDINRTVTARTEREQWVYGSIENRRYFYFENGSLVSWQD